MVVGVGGGGGIGEGDRQQWRRLEEEVRESEKRDGPDEAIWS